MTPSTQEIPIYRGARWEHTLIFRVKGTNALLDLTGLGPFVCEVKAAKEDDILVSATITSDYDAAGQMVLLLTASQTATLGLRAVTVGVRDSLGNPYLEWATTVRKFTPTPLS
jgi:hypothetical protein